MKIVILTIIFGAIILGVESDSCENESPTISWIPSCESDGSFSAVQCKGEEPNGRCFCFDPTGTKIFGWSWWKSSQNMTCSCSRRRHYLSTELSRNDVTLHCTREGNYEDLQCDNGLCWCVEPQTGEPLDRFLPESMMRLLPCYMNKSIELQHGYLRQCESKAKARAIILNKLLAHGRLYTHIDMPRCDYDGSYDALRFVRKVVFCVWKDSERIDNYQGTTANLGKINCNCARDMKYYAEENLEMSLVCDQFGNYESSQTSNGQPYCVDDEGFATSDLGDFGETIICS